MGLREDDLPESRADNEVGRDDGGGVAGEDVLDEEGELWEAYSAAIACLNCASSWKWISYFCTPDTVVSSGIQTRSAGGLRT